MARKHYIDNLRFLMILLLFPFHAAMSFDGGEFGGFFVWLHRNAFLHAFVTFVYPWFMSLLFVLAGISARYSLARRSRSVFVLERTRKLFLPLVLGLFFLVPVQSYIADLFWNGYQGGYVSHLKIFFTKYTYFTGYDGGFTPSHLWFILYLYLYSLLLLPVDVLADRLRLHAAKPRLPYAVLFLLFLPEYLFLPVLNIPSKSVGQNLFLFLTGYFILSRDEHLQELAKGRLFSLASFLISGAVYTVLWCRFSYGGPWMSLLFLLFGWSGILTLIGYGQVYWNKQTAVSAFFSRASFFLYLVHMPVEVIAAYFIMRASLPDLILFLLTAGSSFIVTVLLYLLYSAARAKWIQWVHKVRKK